MKKDIFIDNNIAKNFANPLDPEYKRLVGWLAKYDPLLGQGNAHLVVSKKLLAEYNRTAASAYSGTSIGVLIDKLTREGRTVMISNQEIKGFKKTYYKKHIVKRFRCSALDRDHIPSVLLSDRKYALSIDDDFIYDIINFPGFIVRAAKRPEGLPYAE
jgi:hypothetical protein